MISRTALAASSIGLLALLPVHPTAQQFVLSSQDRARLLAVDFVAVGANGTPVTDLRAEDVTLKVGGRTRPIRSLEYVAVADANTAGEPMAGPSLLPYGSNATPDAGRTIVLIIDQETIRPNREVSMRAHINTFLRGL